MVSFLGLPHDFKNITNSDNLTNSNKNINNLDFELLEIYLFPFLFVE